MLETTSIWPIVAAAFAAVLVGYGWYHPRAFGRTWMRLNATSPEAAERGARRAHLHEALAFVISLVIAYALDALCVRLGIHSVGGAAAVGALVWAGFAAPALLGTVLWEHRSFYLYLINAGYWFFALVAMAIVVAL